MAENIYIITKNLKKLNESYNQLQKESSQDPDVFWW